MTNRNKILKECDGWPKAWRGTDEDVPYGQGLVEAMMPFILTLLDGDVSERTARKHLGHLWLLGGEIIRNVSLYDEYDEMTPAEKLKQSIGPDEGPLCRHLSSESEQRSFDATCGKLCRFLERPKTS